MLLRIDILSETTTFYTGLQVFRNILRYNYMLLHILYNQEKNHFDKDFEGKLFGWNGFCHSQFKGLLRFLLNTNQYRFLHTLKSR